MGTSARITLLFLVLTATGCTSLWQTMQGEGPRQGTSSSLVDFLYPDGQRPPPADGQMTTLKTPLRVGVAFVPSNQPTVQGLSEARKSELLQTASDAFRDREFISEIVMIPETYLRSRGGFTTLSQVARLYELDVIALVSYDQVAVAEDTRASLLYWTILGAYVIKGSRNDVQTFVDTSIFDVESRKLLFRAAGTNLIEASSTLVDSAAKMRQARESSFGLAMQDMTNNLGGELLKFEKQVKESKSIRVVSRSGGGGVGATGVLTLLLLLGFGIAGWIRNR